MEVSGIRQIRSKRKADANTTPEYRFILFLSIHN